MTSPMFLIAMFGLPGSPTRVIKAFLSTERERKGLIFRGEDAVDRLIEELEKEGVLKLALSE